MKPDALKKAMIAQFQSGHKEGYKSGYAKGYSEGMQFTVQNYSSVVLLCLKDKFDFTTEQLKEITTHINNTFDSVCAGYLTLDDILQTLKEENNLVIAYNGDIVELKEDSNGLQLP